MRKLAAAALLLASCYDPAGQCAANADCLSGQVCGPDGLCVVGTPPPPGDPPVTAPDAYAVTMNVPLDVPAPGVLANDAPAATLTALVVDRPAYGTVYLAQDGSFTYAPLHDYVGADAFTYRAMNGVTGSAPTRVSLTVAP